MTNRLQWEVFVSAQIPAVTNDFAPGTSGMKWSPISSTLISGKRDAVLVDTAITIDQNQKLVDWIAASGKNLTTIYATHGHGDHFFGVNTIQKKFPKAQFMATREVIAVSVTVVGRNGPHDRLRLTHFPKWWYLPLKSSAGSQTKIRGGLLKSLIRLTFSPGRDSDKTGLIGPITAPF